MYVYVVYDQSIAITSYDEYPISIIVALFIRPSRAQDNLYNLCLFNLLVFIFPIKHKVIKKYFFYYFEGQGSRNTWAEGGDIY